MLVENRRRKPFGLRHGAEREFGSKGHGAFEATEGWHS